MKHLDKEDEVFARALRAGPPRVKLPDAFAQRVENAWRRAGPAEAKEASSTSGGRLIGWSGGIVALAALGLAVGWLLWERSAAPEGITAPSPPAPVAHAAGAGREILLVETGGALPPPAPDTTPPAERRLREWSAALEAPYEEEARLIAADAARALRLIAASVLPEAEVRALEARGWLPVEEALASPS
ncbi:MAG: hypothetical protein ACLFU2_08665 [Opitutales bacterium]